MRLSEEEVDAADLLEIAMKKHGLTIYEYDGYVVKLDSTIKVKVKKKTAAEFVRDRVRKGEGDGEV